MTIALEDLEACFEGVVPSIISTADSDGAPNIAYLSVVVMLDAQHVAISNQFFAKTAMNIRLNPQVTLLLVDGRTGAQFRLSCVFSSVMESGELFDRVARQIEAENAQIGMAGVMRLRNLDVFRVVAIEAVPSAVVLSEVPRPTREGLAAVAALTETIGAATDAGGIVDALMDGIVRTFGFEQALLLQLYEDRGHLVTIGSVGYEPSGIGSDVLVGEGLIGGAASSRLTMKVSDLSRVRRFGNAIRQSALDENRTRAITLPSAPEAMSQIAVPLITRQTVRGVLFIESRERLAFTMQHETALLVVARHAALALALSETLSLEAETSRHEDGSTLTSDAAINVIHHAFDDSVFINDDYVIKGVAGRLLILMLTQFQESGKLDFTNREIRLDASLKLPDIKDNLETRLLLLRRRLDEKQLPIRLAHIGRGRICLKINGRLKLHGWRISNAPGR